MKRGPLTYLWLIVKTACRHSFDVTHSIILVLIILAGAITYFVPRVEVMVDLNGWQVAAAVLAGIVAVRLVLAPYWIWKEDQNRLTALNDQLANEARVAVRFATKTAVIDDIANEIAWAVHNLVNPNPHPASTSDPESAIAAFEQKFSIWRNRVSKKLENRDVFTQGDQIHFDVLGYVPSIQATAHVKLDHTFSQLALKLERLREKLSAGQERENNNRTSPRSVGSHGMSKKPQRLPITPSVIKKLFAYSGNQCAIPNCTETLVDVSGTMLGKIAHICAAETRVAA
jgi:hypothetical protein